MNLPNGWRWRRARRRVARSIWVVPAFYTVAALVLAVWMAWWDAHDPVTSGLELSASSASTALAALGSGMIAFTGFVTSVILLVVQFGSSQFSPRFVRWFRDDPTVKHSLGTFIATFVFALCATALTGRGATAIVPYRSLVGATVLMLASIGWFLALIAHTSNNLRVARVTQRVDEQARLVFDAVYPANRSEADAAEVAEATFDRDAPVQELRLTRVGTILIAFDRAALLRLAVDHDAVVEIVTAVGDHVPSEGLVLRVHGTRPIPERRLRAALLFGDERTIEDDPAFTLRLLVDVAIKALSPAVNDPTTAVQSLHRIEDILRYAAPRLLTTGVVTDEGGRARVVHPTPTWDDLVSLSLDEIRLFGAGQYQIARRMRALLLDLLEDVPDARQAALHDQLALLDDAVARELPESQRADALVPDRQGLGLARPERVVSPRGS